MRNILIIKCGETYPEIKDEIGSFDDWVIEQTNLPDNVFKVFDLSKGEKLRHPGEYIAAIITGSHYNVDEKHAWLRQLEDWIITAQYSNVPVLGICFGHQMIAKALGGKVEKREDGFNFNVQDVVLTEAGKSDPIFKYIPKTFQNFYSHAYKVVKMPLNGQLLASNSKKEIEAFRVGKTYGVQFHPEFTRDIFTYYDNSLKERGEIKNGGKIKIKDINQSVVSSFLDISLRL
jgi:GMP synthase (glutamine-hydrolysing)